jgi:hypothetical protein
LVFSGISFGDSNFAGEWASGIGFFQSLCPLLCPDIPL